MTNSNLFSNTPIQYVGAQGTRLAYREFGGGSSVPLLMCQRFRGSIDDWDPVVIARLSNKRKVIVFDNAGVGFSEGRVPKTIAEMTAAAIAFVDALGLEKVDVLGFSMGGYIAQRFALDRPDLVRNVILAGTGPGGGDGTVYPGPDVEYWVRPEHSKIDALQGLWFPPTPEGRVAAEGYLARISPSDRPKRAEVAAEAAATQRAAILDWWRGEGSSLPQLGSIKQPVLVVNGSKDVMVPTPNSILMAQRIPNAQLIIYPNSGHAALFQYGETFSAHVLQFLDSQENGGLK